MATTKTLTPTNQAITLADFTEKPDNRTNVTNDDKLADAVNALNSNTAYNTQSFSNLADFKTFLDNMTVGKTSSLLLSGDASNAISGSTYMCSCNVYKIDNNFADIAWIRGDVQIGSARYKKTEGTFVINDINRKVKAVTLEKTVNNGYFTINISTDIGSGYSIASINTVYKSGTTADQLNLCYAIDGNNVYVRTGSGNQLANGTVIKVLVVGIAI